MLTPSVISPVLVRELIVIPESNKSPIRSHEGMVWVLAPQDRVQDEHTPFALDWMMVSESGVEGIGSRKRAYRLSASVQRRYSQSGWSRFHVACRCFIRICRALGLELILSADVKAANK